MIFFGSIWSTEQHTKNRPKSDHGKALNFKTKLMRNHTNSSLKSVSSAIVLSIEHCDVINCGVSHVIEKRVDDLTYEPQAQGNFLSVLRYDSELSYQSINFIFPATLFLQQRNTKMKYRMQDRRERKT